MKFKMHHPTDRMLIFILLMMVALLTAIVAFFGYKTEILWDSSPSTSALYTKYNLVTPEFSSLIQGSLNGLYSNKGVVDINAQKIYIPELKVYLPFNQLARDLKYSFNVDNVPQVASFSSEQIANMPIGTFAKLPCFQFVVGLSVNKADSTNWQYPEYAGSIKLQDGRTLYLYKNSSNECGDDWAGGQRDQIVASLKQAKSY